MEDCVMKLDRLWKYSRIISYCSLPIKQMVQYRPKEVRWRKINGVPLLKKIFLSMTTNVHMLNKICGNGHPFLFIPLQCLWLIRMLNIQNISVWSVQPLPIFMAHLTTTYQGSLSSKVLFIHDIIWKRKSS